MTKPGHLIVTFTPFANPKVLSTSHVAKQSVAQSNAGRKKPVAFLIRNPSDLEHLTRAQLVELCNTMTGSVRGVPSGVSVEDLLSKVWREVLPLCAPEGYMSGPGRISPTDSEDVTTMASAAQRTKMQAPKVSAPVKKAPKAAPIEDVVEEAPAKAGKGPRVRQPINIDAQAEAKAVKETSLLAWMITKMNRKSGLGEDELQGEITERGMANPPRTWVQSDLCRNVGYGAEERNGRYYLRLPEGMDAPHEHKKTLAKPAAAEK